MDYKLKTVAQEFLDMESIKEQQEDILEKIVEQLTLKLDVCAGIPIVNLFATMHKVGRSFFDYTMIMRLLKFYKGCMNMEQQNKDAFYKRNLDGKEAEVGYMILQLLIRLDSDEKALLVGRLFKYCSNKNYDITSFFRISRCVERCFYEDLQYLKCWEDKEEICAQNKLIPQEIIESLYNDGLLLECGIDGGGFKEDEEKGVMYALNLYGKIIANLLEEKENE